MTGSSLTLTGLDMGDSQGDKAVFGILERMGCIVRWTRPIPPGASRSLAPATPKPAQAFEGRQLRPELHSRLPAGPFSHRLFAQGEVRLINVPQARLKETDRIAMMNLELTKMDAKISEVPDGLIIQPSADRMTGCAVESHDDHRIAMSLSLAALRANGQTRVNAAECAAVTFPGYFEILGQLGATTSAGA